MAIRLYFLDTDTEIKYFSQKDKNGACDEITCLSPYT